MARRVSLLSAGGLGILSLGLVSGSMCAPPHGPPAGDSRRVEQRPEGAPGTAAPLPGYILYSPLLSRTSYLVDRQGRVVHTWESDYAPGASVYLMPNGHLLRPARDPGMPMFSAGGQGGRIQEFDWQGELIWDFVLGGSEMMPHHDIEPLPNGNVLAIVWQTRSREQAIRAGRSPELVPEQGLWPDSVLEIEPLPPSGGRIVWQWRVWDHLIQDRDPDLDNYGRVADHPELVDINGDHRRLRFTDQVLERLRSLGYIARGERPTDPRADLLHTNSIAYHPELDQILLSVFHFNEIWVVDHGTTTTEAAGRGGDLLYRWGNPQAYGHGTEQDRQLFGQHDARWVPDGCPGAGSITVFNNGLGRPGREFSSVLEIRPPVNSHGRYPLPAEGGFGPDRPAWQYPGSDDHSFYADFISGAQRLANGNTLICAGPAGRIFEVTPTGDTVWQYRNPYTGDAPNPAGDPPRSVFRASFIPMDHPGLSGRRLAPRDPQP